MKIEHFGTLPNSEFWNFSLAKINLMPAAFRIFYANIFSFPPSLIYMNTNNSGEIWLNRNIKNQTSDKLGFHAEFFPEENSVTKIK